MRKLVIAIPLFNDWSALEKLLQIFEELTLESNILLEILVIDDFSTQPIPDSLRYENYQNIQNIGILRLRRNLGHQRAIAVGITYVYENIDCDMLIVMDGDGEDSPFDIQQLLRAAEQSGNSKIIFAKRGKRSESLTFRTLYLLYKSFYRLLVGREFSVGNFSLLPAPLLKNVVIVSEIWNHYSSGLHRSGIPYLEVLIPRSKRLDGKSKMNLVSLITHGLSSIAVYGDIVGTRILLVVLMTLVFLIILFCTVIAVRLLTALAIPGWATYAIGLLTISSLQLILIGIVFSLIILASRLGATIIPLQVYKYYVEDFIQLKK